MTGQSAPPPGGPVAPTRRALPRAFWRAASLLAQWPRRSVALVVMSVASGFLQALILALVAEAAATMVAGGHEVHTQIGPLGYDAPVSDVLIAAIILGVVQLVLQMLVAYVPASILVDAQRTIRGHIFHAYANAAWPAQARQREGQLQELMTYQAYMASQAVLMSAALASAAISFVTLVACALLIDVPAALAAMVVSSGLILLLRPLSRQQGSHSRQLSAMQLDYAAAVNEAERLSEEAQVFGSAEALQRRISDLVHGMGHLLFRTSFLFRSVSNGYQSIVMLLLVGGLAAVYAIGEGHFASLGALVLMLVRASMYGQQAQAAEQQLQQSLPYVDRVDDTIRELERSPAPDGPVTLDGVRQLSFEDVTFGYRPALPALRDVSFTIEHGEVIGIIGPSGAGKSTMVRLLVRLYTPDAGRYLVNGEPASVYSRHSWNRRVAFLPQEPRLLRASVADNIRFFRDVDDVAVERAARLAHVHDDIVSLAGGYGAVIGPRSDALSVGQAQRVCLARALVAEPDLLVLDEPTSALDPRSESLIQQTLHDLRGRLTIVMVAHRMTMLDICDRAMVVVGGRLEAVGTPADLSDRSPYLRRIPSRDG